MSLLDPDITESELKKILAKPKNLSGSDLYDYNYRLLIVHNFVIHYLAKYIKKTSEKLNKEFTDSEEYFTKVDQFAKFEQIFDQILYVGADKPYKNIHDLFVVDDGFEMVEEPGVYVRFIPGMSKSIWLRQYEKATIMAKKYQINEIISKGSSEKAQVRTQVGLNDHEYIDIYLKIEKKIPKYFNEKEKGVLTDPVCAEKSGLSVVDRVLEDILAQTGIEDDEKLNKLKQRYKNIYYTVAKRYNMPTINDLPRYIKLIPNL